MVRYEMLLLAAPEITADEASTIESLLRKAVTEAGGSFLSYEKWGKYRLAYPVRKREFGVYILVRFEVPEANSQAALQAARAVVVLKCGEMVMRHVVTRLDAEAPAAYQRPESLEEAAASRSENPRDARGGHGRPMHDAPRSESHATAGEMQ